LSEDKGHRLFEKLGGLRAGNPGYQVFMDEQSKVVHRVAMTSERRPELFLRVQALSEHPPVQYLEYHQDSGLLPHKDLATRYHSPKIFFGFGNPLPY